MQYNIFVSYTLRDENITKDILTRFKNSLSKINQLTTFIDILDNVNFENPQAEVFNQLCKADFVWVINSKYLHESEWVSFELDKAKELKKSIYYIDLPTINNIINTDISEINKIIKNYLQ